MAGPIQQLDRIKAIWNEHLEVAQGSSNARLSSLQRR